MSRNSTFNLLLFCFLKIIQMGYVNSQILGIDYGTLTKTCTSKSPRHTPRYHYKWYSIRIEIVLQKQIANFRLFNLGNTIFNFSGLETLYFLITVFFKICSNKIVTHRPIIWFRHFSSIKEDWLWMMTIHLHLIWCLKYVADQPPERIPLNNTIEKNYLTGRPCITTNST